MESKPMDYTSLKCAISAYLNDAANDFFQIGYYLRQVNERQLFMEDGYHNIWEFAKGEYGLSMSSASRFMAINARFSVSGGEEMDPKYQGLGPSKLQEMLGLPEEDLEKITQDTTVREIRQIKTQAKSIEILAKQCEATGSCPDENTFCIAGEKVGTDEGKELCLKCWKEFLKTHPDWKPGIRMEKLLENNAKGTPANPAEENGGAGNTEPDEKIGKEAEAEEKLSIFGLPKMVYPEGSLLSTPGCGSGKYSKHDCFSCSRECDIRQEPMYCVEAPLGNPWPCQIMGNEEWKSRNRQNIYQDKCQIVHPELAPVRQGDKEPKPCCLYCDIKLCFNRCDIAIKRDEANTADTVSELQKENTAEPAVEAESRRPEVSKPSRPEPSRKDIKAFYNWICEWIAVQPEGRIDAAELKKQYRHSFASYVGFRFEGSARGVRINSKNEITWNEAAKRLREIQEEERKASGCVEALESATPDVIDADFEGIRATAEVAGLQEPKEPEGAKRYDISDVERLLRKNRDVLEDCINCMEEDDDPPPVFWMSHIYVDALELLVGKMKKNMDEDTEGDDR